jgi:hypothetical protein
VSRTFSFTFPVSGLVWGVGQWGVDLWGDNSAQAAKKRRVHRSYYAAQLRFSNFYPNQPIVVTSYSLGADILRNTTVSSG